MRRCLCVVLLFCIAAAGFAEAGQYRIAPPGNLRKRQPPRNYRESRLEIVNEDDRGYAIDVDYRRNRLELQPRDRSDIFVPANSRVILTFDDDDDWRIDGDHESLRIEIRSGRTTTLRLETRMSRNDVGLFGIVEGAGRRDSAQLFRYAARPGRPGGNHRPAPQQSPPRQPAPPPPRQPHAGYGTSNSGIVGAIVGGVLDNLLDNDRNRPGPGPGPGSGSGPGQPPRR